MNSWKARAVAVAFLLSLVAPEALAQMDRRSISYRHGYDFGFLDGFDQGRRDIQNQQRFDFAGKPLYQQAQHGFNSDLGFPEDFARGYRRGFENGYQDGYEFDENRKTPSVAPAVDTAAPAPPPDPVNVPISDQSVAPAAPTYDVDPDGRPRLARPDPDQPLPPATISYDPATRPDVAPAPVGETIVPQGTRLRIRLVDTLSTSRNQAGDSFTAEVIDPLQLDQQTALIPAGSIVRGKIATLVKPGRVSGRAQLTLRFEEIETPDRRRGPVIASIASLDSHASETVDNEGTIKGESTRKDDAKQVGTAAAIGAVLGTLGGGGRGAKMGGASGAVIGLAGVLMTRGRDVELTSGTEMEIVLDSTTRIAP